MKTECTDSVVNNYQLIFFALALQNTIECVTGVLIHILESVVGEGYL